MSSALVHKKLHVAEAMMAAGNAASALETLREALAEAPEEPRILHALTRCHAILQQWNEAEEVIAELIATDPEALDGLVLQMIYADRGMASGKKTLERAKDVLSRDPDIAVAWYCMGVAQENLGKYQDAEHAHRRAVELEPDDVQFLTALAGFLSKTGKKEEADALFQRAVELDPEDPSVLVETGTQDLREGRITEAYDKAMWALQQDANDPAALTLLVSIKTKQSPVMGIWWRWAGVMEGMSNRNRWLIVIGLYVVWQVSHRTFLREFPETVQHMATGAWFAFCVLTWVGPWIFKRAVQRELSQVSVRPF